MTLKEQIMKLQTYKMFKEDDTIYVERDEVLKLLEQQPCECKQIDIDKFKEILKNNPPIISVLEQEPCEDAISRQAAIDLADELKDDLPDDDRLSDMVMSHNEGILEYQTKLSLLPSVTPKFTDAEIQKMQDLEQAQLDKAYELGKAEMQPCEDCISRTALLEKIDEERKHLLDLKMDGAEHIVVHHARRIIEDMPVVGSED